MIRNNHAMMGLPQYLLIVLIVTTLLFTLLTQAIIMYQEQTQHQELQQTIDTIISSAEYLSTHTTHGSTISTTVSIPPFVDMISFGPPPVDISKKLGFYNRSQVPDNIYVICYDDGRIEHYYTTISFSSNPPLNSHIFSEGNHQLTLEILEIQEKSYVRIS